MKKSILILALLLAITALSADSFLPKKSKWLGKDKVMHFSGSAFLTVWNYGFFHNCLSNKRDQSLAFSFSVTSIMGIGKEFSDLKWKETGWSWYDLVYDFAGIGFGFILINNCEFQ